jgi:hypothetical protein
MLVRNGSRQSNASPSSSAPQRWRGATVFAALSLFSLGGCLLTTSFAGLTGAGATLADGGPDPVGGDTSEPVDVVTSDASQEAGATAYRAAVLADGPLGYWRLGASALSEGAMDETKNAHAGVLSSGLSLGLPGAIAGDPDTAVGFRASGGQVTIGDLFRFAGTAAFSIEAWVQPAPTGAYLAVLARHAGPDGYVLFIDPGGKVSFERQGTSVFGPRLDTAAFSHVVTTYDGTSLRLYIDGVSADGPTPSGSITGSASSFLLGNDNDGDLFKGVLDEVAVYDHALTEARIAAHYGIGRGH